ncbi:unnamed protein product [Amoebophrya sp. A25]|nr:unnamed protein product [Amoebophrya sp. A25]|eukprot:GSA25T00010810001.1
MSRSSLLCRMYIFAFTNNKMARYNNRSSASFLFFALSCFLWWTWLVSAIMQVDDDYFQKRRTILRGIHVRKTRATALRQLLDRIYGNGGTYRRWSRQELPDENYYGQLLGLGHDRAPAHRNDLRLQLPQAGPRRSEQMQSAQHAQAVQKATHSDHFDNRVVGVETPRTSRPTSALSPPPPSPPKAPVQRQAAFIAWTEGKTGIGSVQPRVTEHALQERLSLLKKQNTANTAGLRYLETVAENSTSSPPFVRANGGTWGIDNDVLQDSTTYFSSLHQREQVDDQLATGFRVDGYSKDKGQSKPENSSGVVSPQELLPNNSIASSVVSQRGGGSETDWERLALACRMLFLLRSATVASVSDQWTKKVEEQGENRMINSNCNKSNRNNLLQKGHDRVGKKEDHELLQQGTTAQNETNQVAQLHDRHNVAVATHAAHDPGWPLSDSEELRLSIPLAAVAAAKAEEVCYVHETNCEHSIYDSPCPLHARRAIPATSTGPPGLCALKVSHCADEEAESVWARYTPTAIHQQCLPTAIEQLHKHYQEASHHWISHRGGPDEHPDPFGVPQPHDQHDTLPQGKRTVAQTDSFYPPRTIWPCSEELTRGRRGCDMVVPQPCARRRRRRRQEPGATTAAAPSSQQCADHDGEKPTTNEDCCDDMRLGEDAASYLEGLPQVEHKQRMVSSIINRKGKEKKLRRP